MRACATLNNTRKYYVHLSFQWWSSHLFFFPSFARVHNHLIFLEHKFRFWCISVNRQYFCNISISPLRETDTAAIPQFVTFIWLFKALKRYNKDMQQEGGMTTIETYILWRWWWCLYSATRFPFFIFGHTLQCILVIFNTFFCCWVENKLKSLCDWCGWFHTNLLDCITVVVFVVLHNEFLRIVRFFAVGFAVLNHDDLTSGSNVSLLFFAYRVVTCHWEWQVYDHLIFVCQRTLSHWERFQ